jgi:hypothetical protein
MVRMTFSRASLKDSREYGIAVLQIVRGIRSWYSPLLNEKSRGCELLYRQLASRGGGSKVQVL